MSYLSDPNRSRQRRVSLAAVLAAGALLAGACSSDASDGAKATSTTATADGSTTTADPSVTTAVTPDTSDAGSAAAAPAEVGAYPVGVQTLDLVDGSRPTKAHGGEPEKDDRSLPVLILYPAAGDVEPLDPADNPDPQEDADVREGRYPLVLMSHGVGARNIAYEVQMATWASAGYVVVAPDHPLANSDTIGGSTVIDLGNQPADLSFLIDVFTDAADDGESTGAEVPSELLDAVDTERIGAVGHSLGAGTVIGLGFGACCADERVDAVVAWAGFEALVQEQDPDSMERPILFVHGTEDGTVPYSQSESMMTKIDAPRWFVTLPGAGHVTPFLSPHVDAASAVVTYSALDFFDAWVKEDPTGIDRLTTLVDDAGSDVATLTAEGT